MKFKKLIALIALFIILIGVSFAKKMNLEKRNAALDAPAPKVSLAKGVSAGFVRRVVVSKGAEEKNRVEIVKNDAGEWTVISRFGARGRKDQVDAVIKNVIEFGWCTALFHNEVSAHIYNNRKWIYINRTSLCAGITIPTERRFGI